MTGLFLHFSHHTRLCPLLGSTNGFYKAIAAAARRRVVASNRKGCKPRLVSCWTVDGSQEAAKDPTNLQNSGDGGERRPRGGGRSQGGRRHCPHQPTLYPIRAGYRLAATLKDSVVGRGPQRGQVDNRVAGPEPQRSIGIVLWKNADRYRG